MSDGPFSSIFVAARRSIALLMLFTIGACSGTSSGGDPDAGPVEPRTDAATEGDAPTDASIADGASTATCHFDNPTTPFDGTCALSP